jgi:HlyD family secretion protein
MQMSIIRELRVKPGDRVRKGDVLAMLDPTFTEADRATLRTQNEALQAQLRRIEAELAGEPLRLEGGADRILQSTIYIQRKTQYESRLSAFDEDIARFKANISATERARESLEQQLGIAREVEDMRDQLYRRQVGTKLNLLDASVVRLRTEREKHDAGNRLADLRHMLASRVVERQIFVDEWRQQLLDEMVRVRRDANAVAENLVKAEKLNDLVVLKAPEDGVVLEIAKKSVGSVLQGAETVVSIVPSTAALIADVTINSADIGYTRIGDEVAIKVDSFPYQRHGLLKGHLRSIGEDSVQAGGQFAAGQSNAGLFHRSQITLDAPALQAMPERTHLIPGMSLTAEIKVGSRTLMSYFLYPLRRGFNESLREP